MYNSITTELILINQTIMLKKTSYLVFEKIYLYIFFIKISNLFPQIRKVK